MKKINKLTTDKKGYVKGSISLPVKHWTKTSDLIRVNNYLTDCVTNGNAFVRDCKKTRTGCKLTVINPHDNGIYVVDCDKKDRIKQITAF